MMFGAVYTSWEERWICGMLAIGQGGSAECGTNV